MSGLLFALALFGCSDDGSACQRISGPEQTYESRLECLSAQGAALDSDAAMAAEFPSVFAQCLTKTQLAHIGKDTVDLRKAGIAFADASS
jgi:hypothetical protein